jgi:predicted GNAT family acetyltransferase
MEILNEDDGTLGSFYIEENNDRVAEMSYTWRDGIMVIEHTEVDPQLEGKGIGKKLVTAAVELARKKSFKIKSVCEFASAVFKRTREFNDVAA